jgi:hypothetical protein
MGGGKPIHQRLAAAFRERDWTAVFIEMLIVVIGVFLALEAANWNESRQERQQERRYYAQIAVDLRRDLQSLETAERRSSRHDRAAENVLAALHGEMPADSTPADLAKDVHLAGFIYLPATSRRTYDELISTGNLGILRNSSIKDAIAGYYEAFAESRQWDGLLRQQQADYWSATAGVVPRKVLQAAFTGGDAQLNPAETQRVAQRVRAMPRLESLLIGMAAHQARVRRDSIILKQRAKALIEELEPLAR